MRYQILLIVISYLFIVLVGCSYRLNGTVAQIPKEIRTIIIDSYEPYGGLTRAIQQEFRTKKIKLIHKTVDYVPKLSIMSSSEKNIVISTFQNGKIAEYQIVLDVQFKIIFNKRQIRIFNLQSQYYLFNNILKPLEMDTKMTFVRQELYRQIANQLIDKMLLMFFFYNKNHLNS